MSTFKFETKMPFPLTRVTAEVHHTKVKKPSGISYIILVIINEAKDRKKKLEDLLIQFGVSKDLHPIFANEIQSLINDLEVIKCTPYEYKKQCFDEYTIDNFKFTVKGKKVFKEELIPSKNTVEDKEDYWYDPARNKLMTSIPTDWMISGIDKSELPNKFGKKFTYDDSVELEEFLDNAKGKGIVVKKEEKITKVKILEQGFFFTTYPIDFEINTNTQEIDFSFEESKLSRFFNEEYEPSLKSKCLVIKRKFKFKSIIHKAKDISKLNIKKVHYPEQYDLFLKKQYEIVVSKGNYEPLQSPNKFTSNDCIEAFSKTFESVHFNKNKVIALAPLEIMFEDKVGNGTLELPFLVEVELSKDEARNILDKLALEYKEYSMDNIKNLYLVYSYLGDYQSLVEVFDKFFNEDIEQNISVLKSIKDLIGTKKIDNWFRQKTELYYNKYFDVISLSAIEYQLTYGKWMIQYLNVTNNMLIEKTIESNRDVEPIEIYDVLEKEGFKAKDLLNQLTLYPTIISYILCKSKIQSGSTLFLKIDVITKSLTRLKQISGITQIDNFKIKEDIDQKEFREVYAGLVKKLDEISLPKQIDTKDYKEFNEFMSNFKYLNSLYTEEIKATTNPKAIKKKQILKKINSNDYFSSIINISVKLEWILKTKFEYKGSLFEMINQLDNEVASKDEKELLHQLRKVRNNLVHPNDKRINLTKEKLEAIVEILFKEEMIQ